MPEPTRVGRYQIRERLGQGGTGALYLALDPAIDRLVALKVLRVSDADVVERFVREAQLAARLSHPNIVTVFDVGEEAGQPFIAMEYIPGETLAELIRRREPLSITRKLTIMTEVCAGLDYAHRHGIVHRDIKPANLIVSRDSGLVKVLDFGIARGAESNITQAGMLLGTPNYMSPEQVRGETVDARSDIFSVGAVLYELLVYRPPFQADNPTALLLKIATEAPTPVATVDPSLDRELAAIVGHALARESEDRYQSLRGLAADLDRVRRRLESSPEPVENSAPKLQQRSPIDTAAHLLDEARTLLDEGALIRASELLERAAHLDPEARAIKPLQQQLTRLAAERDQQNTRAQRVRAALDQAQRAVAQDSTEAARRALAEVLSLDPGHAEARELARRLESRATAPPPSPDGDLVVPLSTAPALTHGPLEDAAARTLVGRDALVDELLGFLGRETGGAFLITGSRGVGKTSFVNRVVGRLGETMASDTRRLIVIRQNLARPMLPVQVLYAILRGLSEELDAAGLRSRLAPAVRRRLDDAVRRTSFAVTRKAGQTTEAGLGLEQPAGWRGLKGGFQLKRTSAASEELVFREYGEDEAEQDLIAISRQLSAGVAASRSRWRRLLDWITRSTSPPTCCRVVFVFDELDKLEQAPASGGRDGAASVDDIVGSLKTLLTTSGITFFFVAGRDMQQRFEQDRARGDSVYESVFAHHIYLPCLWREIDDIGAAGLPNPDDEPVRSFLGHLRYFSRGIPRRAVGVWTSALRVRNGRTELAWSRPQLRRMRFFAGLNDVIEAGRAVDRPHLGAAPHAADADRRTLAIYYLVDWMLAAGVDGFTRSDAIEAAQQLSAKIIRPLTEAAALVDDTLRLLTTHDYLAEAKQGLSDRQLDDVSPAGVARFKLSARRLAELGGDAAPAARDAESLPSPAGPVRIAGYTLGERIGEGNVTVVHKAVDRAGRMVALKMLRASHAQSEIARRRFAREADVLRQLRHKNIVGFVETGETSDGPWLAMEYVPGVRLSQVLASVGRLEPDVAARIALVASDALHHIHERGFVRNDVKPGSIIVTSEGRPCLIDFGIAKSVGEDASLTQIGSFIGTPNYAAPEIWNHQPHDARTDVYAIGAMLFELVTGRTPFAASSRTDLRRAHMSEPATLPADVSVPEALERVILRCLEKHPGARFATMVDLREALRPVTTVDTTEALRRLVAGLEGRAALRASETVMIPAGAVAPARPAPAAAAAVVATFARDALVSIGDNPAGALLATPALRVVSGDGISGNVTPLKSGRSLIGRAPESDIVLEAAGVSRFHAVVVVDGAVCTIEDLNSANGTAINGARSSGARPLRPGDLVTVGDCVLELIPGATAPATRHAATS